MQTIAIVNQKGGVGKSTTAVNLGAGLVRQGKRVLLIDADSQANLTEMLGWQQPDELSSTLATMLERIISDRPIEPAGRYPAPYRGDGLTACQYRTVRPGGVPCEHHEP